MKSLQYLLFALVLVVASCAGPDEPIDAAATSPNSRDTCVEIGIDIEYVVAYEVVDGQLAAPCHGSTSEGLEVAWQILTDIAPVEQRSDIAVFAGFDDPDSDTYAFVQVIDDVGEQFEMTVNLSEVNAQAATQSSELLVTMAHEFSHVFGANITQVDRSVAAADCDTYDGGEGCYYADAILNEWVELFWQDHIDAFTPQGNNEQAGNVRCDIDAGFFGAYAATTPEEDFAEAFGAYVMQIPADSPSQQARLDWIDGQAGLRTFRDRAVQAGHGPLVSNFDRCGAG